MRKTAAAMVALFLIAALLGGCGRPAEQTVYDGKGGKLTTTVTGPKSGKAVFEDKEGKATVELNVGGTVTEAGLGVPIYPGATVDNTGKAEGKGGPTVETTNLSTPDSYDKVCAFYESNLKNVTSKLNNASGDVKTTTFVTDSMGSLTTVVVGSGKIHNRTLFSVVKVLK